MNIRATALVGGAAACLLAVSFAGGASAAPSFVNGSFETGDLTGWTSTASTYNPYGTGYGSGFDGTYWHWLGGYESAVATSQTITGLFSGTTYAVTFLMASELYNSDSLRVSVDGGAGTIFSGPPSVGGACCWVDDWVAKEFDFTATAGSHTIQFDTYGLNVSGYDVGLDKVGIAAISTGGVPEPATWALMLGGFGLMGAALRRRRTAVAA